MYGGCSLVSILVVELAWKVRQKVGYFPFAKLNSFLSIATWPFVIMLKMILYITECGDLTVNNYRNCVYDLRLEC